MALQVEQLVYTSFPETGFQELAGQHVPAHVQRSFVEVIVNRHWNAYSPPSSGYRAAYLHQLATNEILFGWLYSVGLDDMGREGVPYFLCYYLGQPLDGQTLNQIFDCLERGPQTLVERQAAPPLPPPVTLCEVGDYMPVRSGVAIPSGTRARCRLMLDKQRMLDCWVQFEPETTAQETPAEFAIAELAAPPVSASPSVASQSTRSATPTLTVVKPAPPSNLIPLHAAPTSMTLTSKLALLIGVSEYGPGFYPLPGALKDVEQLQGALQHPEQGGFSQVRTLINPDPQTMSEAIETLFVGRRPQDFVLLYFSGYVAVLDTDGKIGLTTHLSRRATNGQTVRSTVVTADFINDVMRDCASQHQTVILDWCYGDLAGYSPTRVTFAPQLTGPQRTVLMSLTSTQAAYVPPTRTGAAYTSFLVEGLKTGAADHNCDGHISLSEWHAYARRRLRQVSPAADPKLYGAAGAATQIGRSPVQSPQFKYRRQVEQCSDQGQVSPAHRVLLNTLYRRLGLSFNEVALIEASVFQPFRDHQDKLQDYAIAFTQALQEGYPLPPERYQQFKQFQTQLGLADPDVIAIETELVGHLNILADPQTIARPLPWAVPPSQPPLPYKEKLARTWAWGLHALQPRLHQLAIVPRHLLSQGHRSLLRLATLRPPAHLDLSQLRPLNLAWMGLGVGLSTLALWFIFNQEQTASRQPRISPDASTSLVESDRSSPETQN